MAKYDPLLRFLRRQKRRDEVILRFEDIERIIGAMLPKAAARPDWWSNAPADGRVQARSWLEAQFLAHLGAGDTVTFKRKRRCAAERPASIAAQDGH